MKLLPCPFCASGNIDPEGWLSSNADGSNYKKGPACDDCGASAESVDRWNTRPDLCKMVSSLEGIPGNTLAEKIEWLVEHQAGG